MNEALIEKELCCVARLESLAKKEFFTRLRLYERLFLQYNKVHNISHFKELESQIIDSLKVLDFRDLNSIQNAIDIGSGAGFPAVFLALILQSDFHLFEPNAKKASFLHLAKTELGLLNIHIHSQKVQDFSPKFKAQLITSRALMKVVPLIKLCEGFFDENSLFLFYKGSELKNEFQKTQIPCELLEFKHRKYLFVNAKEGINLCKFCVS